MNEMIDRVARAMYDASRAKAVGPEYLWFPNEYDRRMARAAIEAMREPTEEMTEIGDDVAEDGTAARLPTFHTGFHVWQAMIGAALKDEP